MEIRNWVRWFWALLLVAVACGAGSRAAAQVAPGSPVAPGSVPAEVAAVNSALEWLALMDGADYAATYRLMAPAFRAAVPEADWVAKLQGLRGSWGTLSRRETMQATLTDDLPEAPPGTYVLVEFHSRFTEVEPVIREFTVMLQTTDGWQPIGYYTAPLGAPLTP